MTATIRAARPGEAAALTDLALRSKAHWGYDAAFLTANRHDLALTRQRIVDGMVYVYVAAGRTLGLYELSIAAVQAEVELLFVAPEAIGTGVGRALWRHLVAQARHHGATTLRIESDPYACGFYEAMGAQRIGEVHSDVIPGRSLPLLEYRLANE